MVYLFLFLFFIYLFIYLFIFSESAIDRATENFRILQILKLISVILKYLRHFEGTDPQGFKFTVLVVVLLGCIPLEH